VTDGTGGAISEKQARERNRMVKVADQVVQLAFENGLKVSESIAKSLLPTPTVLDMGSGKTIEQWESWTAAQKAKHKNGNGHGASLSIESLKIVETFSWGKYSEVIKRWETILGRPAPAPTRPDGKDGNHRLSPEFTEWMMGLEAGWITEVGINRTEQIKSCGNGVVPQQAMHALELLGINKILGGQA